MPFDVIERGLAVIEKRLGRRVANGLLWAVVVAFGLALLALALASAQTVSDKLTAFATLVSPLVSRVVPSPDFVGAFISAFPWVITAVLAGFLGFYFRRLLFRLETRGTSVGQTAMAEIAKLNDQVRHAFDLIESLNARHEMLDKEAIERLTTIEKKNIEGDQEGWRDQMKINQSGLESAISQVKAAGEMVRKAEERLTQRIETDYEQMTDLFARISAIEQHFGLPLPHGVRPFGHAEPSGNLKLLTKEDHDRARAKLEAARGWFAVVNDATGEAVSFGSDEPGNIAPANVLREKGYVLVPIDHQPGAGEIWDPNRRAVVRRDAR